MMTKTSAWIVVAIAAGCGSKDEGKAVVAKFGELEKAMCACKDEACAISVRKQWDDYERSGAIKKPSDKQMSAIMDSEHKTRECETKFVLDESGKLRLDTMKKNLAKAREDVAAGSYSGASMMCSTMDADQFKKSYGAYAATKPDITAFLDDYTAYCSLGIHLEAATKAVEKAEAARAAKPDAKPSECMSADMTLAEIKLKDTPDGLQKLAPLKERMTKVCGS